MSAPRLLTLAEVHTALWRELAHAPHDKQHAWRTPVLATVGDDGADARTVVLREVDAEQQTLTLYTDARAGKVAQLQAQPKATLVFWSRALSWQLRLRVLVDVQTDGLRVASRWARLKLSPAAQDYLSARAPGEALTEETPGGALPNVAPQGVPERGHFAVVTAQVQAIDWLELHPQGHRRAAFDGEGARWLAP